MPLTHLFAGVAVSDFATACQWYEALFGRPPDMVPKDGEAVWHVSSSGSLYVVADAARAGNALVTVAVSDLDHFAAALTTRGLSLNEEVSGASRPPQLSITDRDGNHIKFFADPGQATG
jgi:hypothetical protein